MTGRWTQTTLAAILAASSAMGFAPLGDPLTLTEQAALQNCDTAVGDDFARGIAVTGNTALFGASTEGTNGYRSGAAYVFERGGTGWSACETQKLLASDGSANDEFGSSVAMEGGVAFVGAPNDGDDDTDAGSVYVFARSGTVWSEAQKLTASNPSDQAVFGRVLALSGDTLLVGAPQTDHPVGIWSGSAFVFVRSGTVWVEQAELVAADLGGGDRFGGSVALEGDTAIVGSSQHDALGGNAGAVYVFVRSGTTWSEAQKLTASDGEANDFFGRTVAMDGDTAVIQASVETGANGRFPVFGREGERVFSGGADGSLAVWDAQTGERLATFDGHVGQVMAVAAAPKKDLVVTACDQGTLIFWDAGR